MLGAPAYDFDFALEQELAGTVGEGAGGDVGFVLTNILYLAARESGGIIDMGAVSFDSVTEAPASGYSTSIQFGADVEADWSLLVGRTFCVLTRDGTHYAKMQITETDQSGQRITFDWVYLPDGSRAFP
jgi:hypothetical protein